MLCFYGVTKSQTRLSNLTELNYPYLQFFRKEDIKEKILCVYTHTHHFRFDTWFSKAPWRRKWQPSLYSSLGNCMDRGAWQAALHRVTMVRHDFTAKQQYVLFYIYIYIYMFIYVYVSLLLGKIEGKLRRRQRMSWLDSITDSRNINLGKLREMVREREAWHAAVHGITESDMTQQLNNNNIYSYIIICFIII